MRYTDSLDGITPDKLTGHFAEWSNQPSPEAHLRILEGSDYAGLAVDEESGHVIGFITAISDRISCTFIPHLGVLRGHRGKGIGSELVRRCLEHYKDIYAIDLMCDEDVVPFYERLGLQRSTGMISRNYERQACL